MAEHAEGPIEMVEVKAEDIMPERQGFYATFMDASKWAIGAVIAILVLMFFFLV